MKLPTWLNGLLRRRQASDEFWNASQGSLSDKAFSFLEDRPSTDDLPHLQLEEYRELVHHLAPPTEQQITNFTEYVCRAKSWYKHLPLCPPGEPFHFFIDPNAGLDRIVCEKGLITFGLRTNETLRFHYTWMTTDDYRSRYGYMTFACCAGTRLHETVGFTTSSGKNIIGVLDNNPWRASVQISEETEMQIPREILDIATVCLTGIIHPLASERRVWLPFLQVDPNEISWPEESGGTKTIARIFELCRLTDDEQDQSRLKSELDQLLTNERKRQMNLVIEAINSAVEAIYRRGK